MPVANKFRSALSLAAAALLALSGCSGSGASVPPEPVTVEVWHYYSGPQQDAFNALVNEFNETEGLAKGITVTGSGQGTVGHLTEMILDAAQQNAGAADIPDIFAAYSDTAFAVDALGLVASLDSYLTPQELEEYLPGYLDEGRFDAADSLKIFPVAKSSELLLLNETGWKKFAGATGATLASLSTLEGVTATAQAYYDWTDSLTPAPDDGKAFFGRDSMANYMLIGAKQLGVDLLSVANGEATAKLDPIVLRRLWDNFYIPYINGWFTRYGRFSSDDIKTGDILAQVGSLSSAAFFPDRISADDNSSYDITMLALEAPRFQDSLPFAVQQGAGMVVTKSNPRTERAAVDFLRWFTRKEQNLHFALAAGYLPVTKDASTASSLADYLTGHPEVKSEIAPNMQTVLEVAIRTTETHTMYTNKAFRNGTQARNVLEKSLLEQAQTDRDHIDAMTASGTPRTEAAAQFATDENFALWLSALDRELKAAIAG